MLKLVEWNQILDYAEESKAKMETIGMPVRLDEYSSYDSRRGVAFSLLDRSGKRYTTQYSGVYDNVPDYFGAIDRAVIRLKANYC